MTRIISGNRPHKNTSRGLHLCKGCNRVWEISRQTKKYLYYNNFPSYKLERKTCEKCSIQKKL